MILSDFCFADQEVGSILFSALIMRCTQLNKSKREVARKIVMALPLLTKWCHLPGLSRGAIAGTTVAAIFGATFFVVCVYFVFYRSKQAEEESFLQGSSDEHFNENFRE